MNFPFLRSFPGNLYKRRARVIPREFHRKRQLRLLPYSRKKLLFLLQSIPAFALLCGVRRDPEDKVPDALHKYCVLRFGNCRSAKAEGNILEVNLNYNYFSPSLSFEVKIQGINKKVTFLSCVNTAAKKSLI